MRTPLPGGKDSELKATPRSFHALMNAWCRPSCTRHAASVYTISFMIRCSKIEFGAVGIHAKGITEFAGNAGDRCCFIIPARGAVEIPTIHPSGGTFRETGTGTTYFLNMRRPGGVPPVRRWHPVLLGAKAEKDS